MFDPQSTSQPSAFYAIFQLGVRVQHVSQRLERETGLSLAQWALLKCLVDHPASSALNLARTLGVQPSTLTQSLKRLERKDLLIVTKDPLDARRKLISATRTGHQTVLRMDQRLAELQHSLGLSASPVREASAALLTLL